MMSYEQLMKEECNVIVYPQPSLSVARLVIDEKGYVQLRGKLAARFARKKVVLSFNEQRNVIQILETKEDHPAQVVFAKNGRKLITSILPMLDKTKVALPAVYCGPMELDKGSWRGEVTPNPTEKSSDAIPRGKQK